MPCVTDCFPLLRCHFVTMLLCYCVTVLPCYSVTLLLTASPHFSPTWWQILRKAGKKQPNQAGHSGCQTEQNLAMSGWAQNSSSYGRACWYLYLGAWINMLPIMPTLFARCKNWNQVNTFQVARWENGSGRRVRCSSRFPVRWKHVLTCGVEYLGYQI